MPSVGLWRARAGRWSVTPHRPARFRVASCYMRRWIAVFILTCAGLAAINGELVALLLLWLALLVIPAGTRA
jgi:hypothetical protein